MPIVLVVEDEALIRELVADELEVAGSTVVIAKMQIKRSPFLKPVRISTSFLPISTCPAPLMG